MPRVPRLPFVPDPLRRIHVRRDLETITTTGAEVDPESVGMTREGVDRIWTAAKAWYGSGVHPAMQVCVRREGEIVLDRAIGHARGNGPDDDRESERVLATTETPFGVYSASKAVTAFLVHRLIEKGLISLDEPVATYIPGYDAKGKGGITVGHVLSHRAGVPNLPRESFDLDRAGDRDFLTAILCDAKPFAKPGQLLAYHAISGGYILGEVVHQVTGKDIREVLAEEFLVPLGFRWNNYGVAAEDVNRVGLDYATGPALPPPFSQLLARALGVSVEEVVASANDPRFQTAIVPAGNVVTTANELSRFFEVMRRGGELDGVRVLEPETIRQALVEQSHLEVDLSLGFPTRFSYGLMLGAGS